MYLGYKVLTRYLERLIFLSVICPFISLMVSFDTSVFIITIIICMCICESMPWCTDGGQRTTFGN